MSNKSGVSNQVISLPKGGGALQGIGEKFSPDLHTGTGNFTIPISLPPGRNGFQPKLSMVYSTGNGNGPFGLGWNLSVPGISRKTSNGIPRYQDREDTFILTGTEDLVPVYFDNPQQGVTQYRPRTEGLFARISHIHNPGSNYWEVRSKDGSVNIYGTPRPSDSNQLWRDSAVIADPKNLEHIFTWKLTQTRDSFGNRIVYTYDRDSSSHESRSWDQLYLQEIKYVDYVSPAGQEKFLVTVKFEYEVIPNRYPNDPPVPDKKRIYPFSDYRAGFEIRTQKRCKRITVLTHSDEERLVRTYNFVYLDQRPEKEESLPLNGVSLLSKFEVIGYDDAGVPIQELAPLEFGYTQFEPKVSKLFPVKGPDMPQASLGHPNFEVADLFGNGLPDVLEMNGTVRYWRNLGHGRLDRPRPMQNAPAGFQLADSGVQLMDANGNGRIDLLVSNGLISGYFPSRFGSAWDQQTFQRYQYAPSFQLTDPDVKLIDLTGNGVTDAIRSSNRLECYFQDPKHGWKVTRFIERQGFPDISDSRVKWGDMTGDGLQDVVLVLDGNIEYLPNLGYGNWGKPIRMQNCPKFPNGYNPRRILVGDLDGDGLSDIVYVDNTKITLWINQSGSGWSNPIVITGTPRVSDEDSVRLIDLVGSGVSGILWTNDSSSSSQDNMFFLDLTGGSKPYLLNEMDNHIGALTRVEYASSIRYFLEDEKRPETSWRTPLPFPVQVVAKVEVIDQISRSKMTTEYSYHHGYWDGAEREFRGFGRVEQRDSEVFAHYHAEGLHADLPFEQVASKAFSPPLLTRTWFHQGPVGDENGDWKELNLSNEYWTGDSQAFSRQPVTDFLNNIGDRRVKRDALRTLQGSILRTEMYALDGTDLENRPYTITEIVNGLREETPPHPSEGDRKHIFFPFKMAERTTQWERGHEPMTQFSFMGTYDKYGQPLMMSSIAVPRGRNYRESAEPDIENPYLCTVALTDYAQRDDDMHYIVDRVARTTMSEIINDGSLNVFQLWEAVKAGTILKRTIGQTLHYYDGIAYQGLPFSKLGEYGALVRTENLVLTKEMIQEAYHSNGEWSRVDLPPYLRPDGPPAWNMDYPDPFRNQIQALAGYHYHVNGPDSEYSSGYFQLTERRRYDFHELGAKGRGLLITTRDPLGQDTEIMYDTPYQLLPVKVIDSIGLTTEARYNYRVLQPSEVMDPNNNKTKMTFTPSGLLKTISAQGKVSEGDQQRPGVRLEYDFMKFMNSGQPISIRTVKQIHHDTEFDVTLPKRDESITTMEYSDGFGRLLQTRTQAANMIFGESIHGDAGLPSDQSNPLLPAIGQVYCTDEEEIVVVSGWKTYDNKGRVVEQFEPFYSCGRKYAAPTPQQLGQKITMYYDPRGQVIRTVNPDGSEQRVIYGIPTDLSNPDEFIPTPWEAYHYDANDLAPLSYDPKALIADGSVKRLTDYAPVHHHFTPSSIIIDALGRTVETVQRNRVKPESQGSSLPPIEEYRTRSFYDIQGNLLMVTDALQRIASRYVYDFAGQQLRNESIDGGTRCVFLDAAGNIIEHRDSKGAFSLHSYDVLGRPTHLWAKDSASENVTLRNRLIYGDGSNKNQPVDERETSRKANRLGKLYHHYDEAGRMTFEVYDFKGNNLEKVRQVIRDSKILNVFEEAEAYNWKIRPFKINWQPAEGVPLNDHANSLLDSFEYRTSVHYDAMNRMKLLRYPKDVDGNRKIFQPVYNQAGELEGLSIDSIPFVNKIAYNAKGQRLLIAYSNGVMTRYSYSSVTFRPMRMRTEKYTNSPGTSIYQPAGSLFQDLAYKYDLAGNIWSIEDRTPKSGVINNSEAFHVGDPILTKLLASGDAFLRHFEYDALYRLSSATGREYDTPRQLPPWVGEPRGTDLTRTRKYTEIYRYDQVGNIIQFQQRSNGNTISRDYSLETNSNRLLKVIFGQTAVAYAYDGKGSLTQETDSRHFEWDYADRMRVFRTQTDSAEPSVHAQYFYDTEGQRVKKLVRKQGGQVEVTVYIDGFFEHQRIIRIGSVQENNTLQLMDNQNRIALVRVGAPFPDDSTPAIKYQLGDHLGSSNLVIDDSANWVNREEFTPYGESSYGSFARKRYRYTGKERDEESGLNYHGARFYSPYLGRWTSCDPIRTNSDSLYVYCYNRPVVLHDLDGEIPTVPYLSLPIVYPVDPGFWRKAHNWFVPPQVPLNTERLLKMAESQGLTKGNAPRSIESNRVVGRMFQERVLRNLMLPENHRYFRTDQRERRASPNIYTKQIPKWVVPDAVADAAGGVRNPYTQVPRARIDSTFIEVKAVNGPINLSHSNWQILGMIDYLSKSPASGSKGPNRPFPTLYFVTTSDTYIDSDVIDEATAKDVVIWQSITYTVRNNIVIGTPFIVNPQVFTKNGIPGVAPTSPFPVIGPTGPLHSQSSPGTNPDPTIVQP